MIGNHPIDEKNNVPPFDLSEQRNFERMKLKTDLFSEGSR